MRIKKTLHLELLSQFVKNISSNQCNYYAEGCIIALEELGHQPGVKLKVEGVKSASFILRWDALPQKSGWQESRDIAEAGSIALAFFVILELTDFQIIQQAVIGTGFDYWLGYKEDHTLYDPDNFINARLEVSGILNERKKGIIKRIRQKTKQVSKSDDLNIPAFIVVVEFGTPICIIIQHECNQAFTRRSHGDSCRSICCSANWRQRALPIAYQRSFRQGKSGCLAFVS
ncbi:MAG: hypothetical protein KDD01_23510 [Phaeodactylibacter sp.]|nr:hypothetical protein [Phaeodactylibacter sp.]